MKSTLGILGLILAMFVGATPSHSRARGDDFTAVVKLIEQFYHVKHQSIPLMARAAMNAARTTARIKGGDAKHLAEAGSVRVVFFENQDFNSHGQIASFKAAMKTALDQQWSALVQTLLPKEEESVSTETIKGKNGATVTRTVLKDGSVNIKRVNSSGHVTIELDDIYDMAAAVREASRTAQDERPNSQTSIVWVSDGIAPIFYEDRDATEQILIRSNAIFSSLTVDLRARFKFLLPFGRPIANWMGVSLYGSARHLAQQSGGEAVRVNRVSDYGSGLAKIIGNLTARYSLGFALAEQEKDDGRMHELALRVKALDVKGKTRNLEVSSRRGYYTPKAESEQTTANK